MVDWFQLMASLQMVYYSKYKEREKQKGIIYYIKNVSYGCNINSFRCFLYPLYIRLPRKKIVKKYFLCTGRKWWAIN